MKIKILAVIASLIGLATAIPAHAQTNLSFLTSKAALRAYAVEQATTANTFMYSPSQVGNQQTSWAYALPTNHTSADILKVYSGQAPSITVLNTQDPIYLSADVANSDGDGLFYGGASAVIPPGYKIGFFLNLTLAQQIPVKFGKQVAAAQILYVDPSTGQTYNWQQLYGYGNKIYFPSDSAGDGFLQVTFTDGSQANYDLRTGGKVTGTSESLTIVSASIDNLLSYTNPPAVIDQLQSSGGVGENRTYEVIETSKTVLGISVSTTEGALPVGYYYRPQGSLQWQYVPAANGVANIPITAAGTWYVIPQWDPTQFAEPAPNIWNYGGKG